VRGKREKVQQRVLEVRQQQCSFDSAWKTVYFTHGSQEELQENILDQIQREYPIFVKSS
jgi:hypothetical protein